MTTEASLSPKSPSEIINIHDVAVGELATQWQDLLTDELADYSEEGTPNRAFILDYQDVITEGMVLDFGYSEHRALSSRSILLIDKDQDGKFIGYGILVASEKDLIPYPGDTLTEEEFRRKGLAKRRLEVMNVIAKQVFGDVLHSSINPLPEPEAIKVWQKLEQEGDAVLFETEIGPRWKFAS